MIAADQATKAAALAGLGDGRVALLGDFLGLRLVTNTGGAFGLLRGLPILLLLGGVGIVGYVSVQALRGKAPAVPFGLIAGGGAGNLIDRLFRPPSVGLGKVVDFIDFSFWPTFNLADVGITLGVGLVLLSSFRSK